MSDAYEDAKAPDLVAEPGFYWHYKHNSNGPVNDKAYYILGTGHHTEDDARPEDTFMQVYMPLYESHVYKLGKMFDLRPLSMAVGNVTDKADYSGPRFIKIEDPAVIGELQEIARKMYGPWAW